MKHVICISLIFAFNFLFAQNDTVFHKSFYTIGEVFYVGHQTVRVELPNEQEEIRVIPTSEVSRIFFADTNTSVYRNWMQLKNPIQIKPNTKEFTPSQSVKVPEISDQTSIKSQSKEEMRLGAYYLNRSAINHRNKLIGGTISGIGAIGWASQVINISNGIEPTGLPFFQVMTIGGSLISLVNNVLFFQNMKKSAIHFEASSDYIGLSMVIPIGKNTFAKN
jgi:hypothetical protein